MSGRRWVLLLVPLLALALAAQLREAERRWRADRLLAQIEQRTAQLSRSGRLSRPLLERGLELLREAAELNPVEVGIPIARGTLYSLLRRPQAARRAYDEALELEQRAEIYANKGRAYLLEDNLEAVRGEFRRAIRLNPRWHKDFRRYLPELDKDRRAPDKPGKKHRPRRRKATSEAQAAGPEIFADGFESGTPERWSQTVVEGDREEEK